MRQTQVIWLPMKVFFAFIWMTVLTTHVAVAALPAEEPVFRFHLLVEPHTLDPQVSTSASGNYVVQNVRRGLTRLDADKGLVMEGAKACKASHRHLRLTCTLSKDHRWSNGQPVKASEYVRAFRRVISASNKSPQAELLFTLKNAQKIWDQKLPMEKLGVEAPNDKTLVFSFERPDPEFLLKLTHPALAPMSADIVPDFEHAADFLATGPYRIKEWRKGDRVVLEKNPFYKNADPHRPLVEALFIEEDSTALRLYESGILTFLRRFPSAQISAFRHRPDFVQKPMARFDYLGFGPGLKNFPELRKALSLSLDFENFSQLFDALGRPGCPSLPPRLYDGPLCLSFEPKKAKELFKKQPWPEGLHKQLEFSRMGGDDIQRAAEWFQGQWKKNLGLSVEIEAQEQGGYLKRLSADPPALFRKGIGLERPTCLAALENFVQGHPENYIRLDSKKYSDLVERMKTEFDAGKVKKLCTEAIRILIDENWLIPLGEIHFTMLASPRYPGWTINSINQLDLSFVHFVPDKRQVR